MQFPSNTLTRQHFVVQGKLVDHSIADLPAGTRLELRVNDAGLNNCWLNATGTTSPKQASLTFTTAPYKARLGYVGAGTYTLTCTAVLPSGVRLVLAEPIAPADPTQPEPVSLVMTLIPD